MRPFLLNRLRWAWTVKVAVAVTALAVGRVGGVRTGLACE